MYSWINSLVLALLIRASAALQTGGDSITSHLSQSSTPIPPSQDPFYTAPVGYEYTAPGTILRIRRAPGNLTTVMGSNCSAAYNIVYRTTDSLYRPSWSVTTLFVPSEPMTSTSGLGSALVAYQFPYNSVDVDSSPSYWLYSNPLPEISNSLGYGWFVNVPDFEGPLPANVAGIEEAHAVLDSIRAIRSSNLGIAPDSGFALWGYSGGSIASEWALEFQEQYAPELNITGAALGGLVPNTTYVFDTVGGTIWASHAIAGLIGVSIQYEDAWNYLLSQLKTSGPYNKTGFLSIRNMSYDQGHEAFSGQNMYDYFINGSAIMQAPLIKYALQHNTIMTYHGVPQVPLFIYKAIHDEITPVNQTDAYVQRSCSLGVNILYQRNTIGGHVDEFSNGDARSYAWLDALLSGTLAEKYPTTGCTIQNVTFGPSDTGL